MPGFGSVGGDGRRVNDKLRAVRSERNADETALNDSTLPSRT